MNKTRIVVPAVPEPSAPNFDDEATLVTARPVVPIARARAIERSRISLMILAGISGAVLFGAAGAVGVNYFKNPKRATVIPQSQTGDGARPSQPLAESPQAAAPASSEQRSAAPEPDVLPQPDGSVADQQTNPPQNGDQAGLSSTAAPPSPESSIKPAGRPDAGARSARTSSDLSRLVRKRLVRPLSERSAVTLPEKGKPSSANANRSAGRIREIFEGPNPP